MVQESKVFNPDRQIDCVGLFCPMPIVKTREAIQQMAVGQLLEMRADDPASEADMKSWVRITGHDLVGMVHEAGIYRFLVRKTR
jgi:tRNA 2-thiouridine synthesizing protein A